jgi:hypothetical protein
MAAMATDNASIPLSRAVKLCGTEATNPPSRQLAAGSLTAELENGQLRYVTFAGAEALRAVAFLVRDENWGTYTPQIDSLEIKESAENFVVSYRAICADSRQRLVYHAQISGSSDGSLAFVVVAAPETDVVTNRTGFVVLHSAGLAGQKVRVTHVDGRVVETHFPDLISPSQPIFDIRALAHEVSPGLWAACRMEGDTFEMEDQRNWCDASYKTYVRPLSLPWGYTLAKGSRMEQAVRLSFSGAAARSQTMAGRDVAVVLGGDLAAILPDIGVGLPAEETSETLAALDTLRSLNPRFLVGAIDARDGRGLAQLDVYRGVAAAVPAALVMEIVVPDEMDAADALAPIAAAIARAGLRPEAVAVSSAADLRSWQPGAKRPEKPSVEEICTAARAAFPGVRLGGGMLSTFTELNRKRPKAELLDYVTHTTCSIVHAADDRSVMETLETLPAIIASTKAMIGNKPYRIGPTAIAARDNPYGKSTAGNPDNGRVCLAAADPRQRGLFNAAWTVGYVSACAYGGLEAVAMGAATGPFGFIQRRTAHSQPYFGSIEGPSVYPAFHVMAGLVRGCGRRLIEVRISSPGRAAALAWREGGRVVLWLANLTAEPLAFHVTGLGDVSRRLSVIDAASFEQATLAPEALDALARPFEGEALTLDAYAAVRID